jgi:hypothetical protein
MKLRRERRKEHKNQAFEINALRQPSVEENNESAEILPQQQCFCRFRLCLDDAKILEQ